MHSTTVCFYYVLVKPGLSEMADKTIMGISRVKKLSGLQVNLRPSSENVRNNLKGTVICIRKGPTIPSHLIKKHFSHTHTQA